MNKNDKPMLNVHSDRWPSTQRIVVVSKERHFEFLRSVLPQAELTEDLPDGRGYQLIAFGTGLIIPSEVLKCWDQTINFHGASPEYPGRDPHHWASYDSAKVFGATAHAMWPKVDAGQICGVLLAGVTPPRAPSFYQEIGEAAARSLCTAWCRSSTSYSFENDFSWTGRKRSRRDLISMCDMRGLADSEKERRKSAFRGFEKYFIE